MEIYVPHKAMKELMDDDEYYYGWIRATVVDPAQAETVARRIKEELKRYHKDESVSAVTLRTMLKSLD